MTEATSVPRQPVLPQLRYERPNDAVDWLCRVFGFVERSRMAGPDGTIYVADLEAPGGGAMLVSGLSEVFKRAIRSVVAADFRDVAETAWPNLSYSITVLVPDVDAHYDARGPRRGARAEHARRSTVGSARLRSDRPRRPLLELQPALA